MSDPRSAVIERRLATTKRIIAFASGKGGVGKSSCSAVAALLLARGGYRTGLLDLDFHGATDHLILGIEPALPDEEGGILPLGGPFGLRFMGISPFVGNRGVALRGEAVSDAILELLAVVVWGELDVLVVDMPPGIGEAVLDFSHLVPRIEVALVSTPSVLSWRVMLRLHEVLAAGGVETAGYLLNMVRNHRDVSNGTNPSGAAESPDGPGPLLGSLPFLDELEEQIGVPDRLLGGRFAGALSGVLERLSLELPLEGL